jgi:trk system potassium uptake protein TrkH
LVSVWGFFSLYVIAFIFIMVALMFTGLDQVSSFSATVNPALALLGQGLKKSPIGQKLDFALGSAS